MSSLARLIPAKSNHRCQEKYCKEKCCQQEYCDCFCAIWATQILCMLTLGIIFGAIYYSNDSINATIIQ
uniref:Uncharacterized protein n=1 Tax=viral metagenome TaxID=1070528 RepID=A0A6C0C9B2_9ZZZZ